MKCDKLQSYKGDVTIPVYGTIADADVYLKEDADKAIAEQQSENAELKKKLMPCLNGDCILTCEVVEKYGKENAELKADNKMLKEHIANGDVSRITWIDEVIELKQKLESVQASMYADVVDSGMRERRLKRALWLARAYRAKAMYTYWHVKCIEGHLLYEHKWIVVERKCRAKAEEYK